MALLAVAGTVAAVCIYRRMDEEIRRRAVAQIAKHYPGLRVAVGSAQLVEGKGVRVYDVVIAEPGAEGPQPELLRFEEMLLECPTDWKQLIQGDLPVRRVTIRRPVLRVTRRPDGTWSVAKLLQSAHGAGPCPPVTVENGIIEIFDPLKTPPATLTLRDVNLTLAADDAGRSRLPGGTWPAPQDANGARQAEVPPGRRDLPSRGALSGGVRRLQGMFSGDGFRHVGVEGSFDPGTRAFFVRGRTEGLDISPELRESLPEELSKKLSALGEFELRGQADVGFEVSYDPAAVVPLRFNVSGQLVRGRIDTPRLPHAMTEIRAAVRVDNGGLSIDGLTARIGQGGLRMPSYRQSGFDSTSPRSLTAELRQLELDRGLWDICPVCLQEQWRKYLPAGAIDAQVRLDYDGRVWRPQLTAQCLNVSFTHYRFPYRMEHGRGSARLEDDRLSLDLTAYMGTRPVHLTAEVEHPFCGPAGWFQAKGEEILLDEALLAALPEKPRELVRSLDARGTVNFDLRTWRQRPDELVHQHLKLGVNGCWVRFNKFPYPLSNVRGELEMTDGAWTLRGLEGTNNTARVTCNGSLGPVLGGVPLLRQKQCESGTGRDTASDEAVAHNPGADPSQDHELILSFEARDVTLDEQLRDALSPHVQQVWHTLQPHGVVDLTAEVRYRTAEKKFSIGVRARPQPQTASIEPVHFPYRLDRLEGTLLYRDGHVTFEHCKAEHGPVKIATEGYCDLAADGRWHVYFGNLSVNRLRADRELVQALPERLKRVAVALSPTGLMNLRGRLDVEHSGGPAEPSRWEWDVALGLQQAGLRCGGLMFENVCGEVSLLGRFDREHVQSRGELALDSLTYKDCQLTQVRGPIWIDDGRVLFGAEVDRSDGPAAAKTNPPRAPRSVTAGLFGGTLAGDGWVTLGPEPHYALNATLTDADLARCGQNSRPAGSGSAARFSPPPT